MMGVRSILGGMKKGMCLETFSKSSDYSVLIPTSLDVENKNNSKIVAPRFIWGSKKTLLPKRLPSTLTPAPKGVGYDFLIINCSHS